RRRDRHLPDPGLDEAGRLVRGLLAVPTGELLPGPRVLDVRQAHQPRDRGGLDRLRPGPATGALAGDGGLADATERQQVADVQAQRRHRRAEDPGRHRVADPAGRPAQLDDRLGAVDRAVDLDLEGVGARLRAVRGRLAVLGAEAQRAEAGDLDGAADL